MDLTVSAEAALYDEDCKDPESYWCWHLTITMRVATSQGRPIFTHSFMAGAPNSITFAEWRALIDGVPESEVSFQKTDGDEYIRVCVDQETGVKMLSFVVHPRAKYSTASAEFSVPHDVVAAALEKELTAAAARGYKFAQE